MDEEIERLVVSVRADTSAFARDVAVMRETIDGPLQQGAERAGRAIEATLLRAIRTGKLGFEDLKRLALQVLEEIASAAIRAGIDQILGRGERGGGSPGGLLRALGGLIGGLPGRATGGPVSPGAAYLVGERGPELFVPTSAGRVEAPAAARGTTVAITINARPGEAPAALRQSSRQVARAVKAALEGID